jgi:hypothetical protein
VSNPNIFQSLMMGARKSEKASKAAREFYPSALNLLGRYHDELKKQGVTATGTPVQAAGAFATRIATDVLNDGTRGFYWRYNHPLAILDKGIEKAIGKEAYKEMGPLKTGLVGGTIALPVTALAGTYNILNPGEAFRAPGFAQSYAEKGAEDRRQTTQPAQELFERFFLGRTGAPLKYATAKEEIPNLTPEKYSRFMRSYYQDKGLLGVVKYTPENLQGVPEVRALGYPVNIASASAAVGGLAGASAAIRSAPTTKQAFTRGLAGGGAGSITGAAIGTAINAAIANRGTNRLPTTQEYGIS